MTEHQPAFGKTSATRGREAGVRRAAAGFWHRPDWMNLVSDVLILVASVLLGMAAVKAAVRLPLFGLREVVIVSPLSHVTHAQLEYVAASALGGNFFTVNLEKGRTAFENLPWVRSAQLRRQWPGAIEVSLEEHVAVAYWRSADSGDTRLVNGFGELFDAAANDSMPVFSGPPEASMHILAQMRRFNELLQPINRNVVALSLSGRHAWQLKLDDGMVVEVGKDQAKAPIDERLKRFVSMWPQLTKRLPRAVMVADLRYPSGFAVRMAGSEQGKGKQ
ncbi:cell division protein FtsQ/DivIB [Uliginosibacterium sp. TH139]|uniref:cell division protein FtsQ/DivIB n=1 Tax=Uliginosibacterium sp. TH139 TaxID=2067453 RepID=UPI000C7A499A|nr:cell division protein FtsQ/DivIB [Uliginosibacterium sp. TH139]PLK47180.1 cell division protein [Uliginosibacterium sp. TH139]